MASKSPKPAKPKAPSNDTTTARFSRQAHKRAKVYAAQHDMELGDLIDQAIDEFLRKRGA